MNRILRRRILRELKDNLSRYLSLMLMIILSMYLIISIVDAAEIIIQGTEYNQRISNCEDGQVTVFTPLTEEQLEAIEEAGVTIEPHLSFDVTADEDGSALRIFKNRESIDTVILEDGALAQTSYEVVLEKRYCEEHDLKVGDTWSIEGEDYLITGIGTTVDYDAPLRKASDTAIDSEKFGTAFVSEEVYDYLLEKMGEIQEDLTYAFVLNDTLSADELKDMIKSFDFDYKQVEDKYYRELLDDTYGKKDEIQDGIDELVDGVSELKDGVDELADGTGELKDGMSELYDGSLELTDGVGELKDGSVELDDGVGELLDGMKEFDDGGSALANGTAELREGMNELHEGAAALEDALSSLQSNNGALNSGSEQIFDGVLAMAQSSINASLSGLGMGGVTLTKDNYASTIDSLAALMQGYGMDASDLNDLKTSLDGIAQYVEGVQAYTDAEAQIAQGAGSLRDGATAAMDGTAALDDGAHEFHTATGELTDGVKELKDGTGELKDGVDELYDGSVDLSDGIKEAYDGSVELDDGVGELADGVDELYDGVDELKEQADDMLDELFDETPDNITAFLMKADNVRIGAGAGDVIINKQAGMVAGVIIMILFTYVLSVFVIHQIQNESSVIGALYALGVKKRDLIGHYVTLPTVISIIGGFIGAVVGFSPLGVDNQTVDTYSYYSVATCKTIYPAYLIIYAVIMPPLVSLLVNYIVINKSLSRTALSLIKNEQKMAIGSNVNLGKMGFLRRFQIRQMLRERRTGITIAFGMIVSMLVLMMGLDCLYLCLHVSNYNARDTKYEYMYTYKYPTEEVPEGGEAVYMEALQKEKDGYTLDISIIGIDEDNKYYDVTCERNANTVIASQGVCTRYGVSVGDKLILSDNANDKDYVFTIAGITDYSVGLSIFMDIDRMREYFDKEDDYYNVVLADEALDIEEGRLYSTTAKADVAEAAQVFVDLMASMVIVMVVASAIIFALVMYLMISVMIDRASFGIALVKIFGYRTGELKKLYLNGNLIIIVISALVSIPVSKVIMDAMFPSFVANVACDVDTSFPFWLYVLIFAVVILCYLLINSLLVGKIKKILPAEVLKNRE